MLGCATTHRQEVERWARCCCTTGWITSLGPLLAAAADEIELATEKVPRGARQRLCENQVIQSQRAQAEARLGSARAFLLSGFAEIWEAVGETGELSLSKDPPRLDLGH
jgi:hypothetical protein